MPPSTVAFAHDKASSSFYAITRPETKTMNVESSYESFRLMNCESCPIAISEAELFNKLQAEGKPPLLPNKITYCSHNNVCNGSDLMIDVCAQGHKLTNNIQVNVQTPHLLWVWDYSTKSKMAWRLYGISASTPVKSGSPELLVKPYLLANVYLTDPGAICWGKTKKPRDLKEAYYFFWEAPFNTETSPAEVKDLASYVTKYSIETDNVNEFKSFNFDKINWFWSDLDVYQDGLMFTEDTKLINSYPNKVTKGNDSLLIKIKKTDSANWMLNINDYICIKQGKLTGTAKVKVLYKERSAFIEPVVSEEHIIEENPVIAELQSISNAEEEE
jgi:uncharacterized protein YegJ (DUF2314 family)